MRESGLMSENTFLQKSAAGVKGLNDTSSQGGDGEAGVTRMTLPETQQGVASKPKEPLGLGVSGLTSSMLKWKITSRGTRKSKIETIAKVAIALYFVYLK